MTLQNAALQRYLNGMEQTGLCPTGCGKTLNCNRANPVLLQQSGHDLADETGLAQRKLRKR
jgi:hypothetical protein